MTVLILWNWKSWPVDLKLIAAVAALSMFNTGRVTSDIVGNHRYSVPELAKWADSRYMSEEAFARATSTADKELFLVPGATHIRTYFVKEYVDQISAKIREFFGSRLAKKD